jgi:transcriptional regulator with XRE-family HTH domain
MRTRPLLRTALGEVLRRARLAQGRTLADVSRAARVSVPYLSELERGRKEASSEVLAAICDALGIDLADLLAAAGHRLDQARRPAVVRLGFGPAAADTLPGPPLPEVQPADDLAVAQPVVLPEAVSPEARLDEAGELVRLFAGVTRRPGDAVGLLAA